MILRCALVQPDENPENDDDSWGRKGGRSRELHNAIFRAQQAIRLDYLKT